MGRIMTFTDLAQMSCEGRVFHGLGTLDRQQDFNDIANHSQKYPALLVLSARSNGGPLYRTD
jgi:hypothetical protein